MAIAVGALLDVADFGPWSMPWSPTLTNITQGSGSIIPRYYQLGKTVFFRITFNLGSGSAIATDPTFSLPVTLLSGSGFASGGSKFTHASPFSIYGGFASYSTTTVTANTIASASGQYGQVTSTVPFTWTSGDTLEVFGVYEAA